MIMPHNGELLYQESVSKRKLPVNLNPLDINLFNHECEKVIPSIRLIELNNVNVNPDGILFHGTKILTESFAPGAFVYPKYLDNWIGMKGILKLLTMNYIYKHEQLNQDVFWFVDFWSKWYYHWLTDALPRLFAIRENISAATILLPDIYREIEYVQSSLKAFAFNKIKYIKDRIFLCRKLIMPTHTAPSFGNYNEGIIRGLRGLYTNFYNSVQRGSFADRIYISRAKAKKRKIVNEEKVITTLKDFGFQTIYFEDHPFEHQVKIASNAQYIVSNHGTGLVNMLFMAPGGNVLELRQKGDCRNNHYFSLTSALDLNYFYQTCESEVSGEDALTANVIVDIELLKMNIKVMLDS